MLNVITLRKVYTLAPFLLFFFYANTTLGKPVNSCTVIVNGQKQTSYFSPSNKKAEKRCQSKIKAIKKTHSPSSKKYKITTTIRNHNGSNKKCSAYGGTVKVNGKTFHLDPNLLCKKYGINHKGSIRIGKTHAVDKHYRKRIAKYVNRTAKKHNIEPAFIHAIISAESAYNPSATSKAGAMGLMQLMPFTAKRFGVINAYDAKENISGGVRYLKILLSEFGSLQLAAASYNAGEGAVRKYKNNIPPYKETQAYVPKVMAFYKKYKDNPKLIDL